MKRNIFLVLLLLVTIFCAYGQNASPIDLVLLLDTSSTMSSSYENVNNYITGNFLNEFLRVGDTFHLIAFSANPRLDAARRISGIGDVETIIARMLLQYPVETGSNISAALAYCEQYITTLPSRPKKIVLVSTGGSDTGNLVNASKQRLNSKNATLDYIQVTPGSPLSNVPKSGRPAAATRVTTTTTGTQRPSSGASAQTQTTSPGTNTGTSAGTGTSAAGTSTGTGTTSTGTPAGTSATGVSAGETNTGAQGQNSISGSNTDQQSSGNSANADNYVSDSKDTQNYISAEEKAKSRNESYATSLPFFLFVIIIILLLLGLIIFLASRKLGSSPNRVMAEVASTSGASSGSPQAQDRMKFVDHSKDLAKYASVPSRRSTPYDNHPLKPDNYKHPIINPSGPLLLNLFVEDQNTSIGKRNIHSLKSGYSLTVGGGKSDDYLIFLVPIPAHIGEIRRNGSSLTFIPRKPKYFPDIGSNEVKDCINKTIRIVSDKHYEMRFRFEMYEDPLIALNRILMSVKVPG